MIFVAGDRRTAQKRRVLFYDFLSFVRQRKAVNYPDDGVMAQDFYLHVTLFYPR